MDAAFDPSVEPAQLQAVLDCVSDGVFTITRDFTITTFNRSAERITGFRRADVLGRRCYEVFRSAACRSTSDCPMRLALRTGGGQMTRELKFRGGHSADIPVRLSFHPLRAAGGTIVGGVETFRELAPAQPGASIESAGASGLPLLEASERRVIEDVLRRHAWNRTAAAQELSISRITLWRKMHKLGIGLRPTAKNS